MFAISNAFVGVRAADEQVNLTRVDYGRQRITRVNLQTGAVVSSVVYKHDPGARLNIFVYAEGCGDYSISVKKMVCQTVEESKKPINYMVRVCGETSRSLRLMCDKQNSVWRWLCRDEQDEIEEICTYALDLGDIGRDLPLSILEKNFDGVHRDVRVEIGHMCLEVRWNSSRKVVEIMLPHSPCGEIVASSDDIYNGANAKWIDVPVNEAKNNPTLCGVIDNYLSLSCSELHEGGRIMQHEILPHGLVKCIAPMTYADKVSEDNALTLVLDLKRNLSIQSFKYCQKKSEDDQYVFSISDIEPNSFEMHIKTVLRSSAGLLGSTDRVTTLSSYKTSQGYFLGIKGVIYPSGCLKGVNKECFHMAEKPLYFTRFGYHAGLACFVITDDSSENGVAFSVENQDIKVYMFYECGHKYQYCAKLGWVTSAFKMPWLNALPV